MRVFSIFVSALAFANLAQAAPLADTEFAQLEAELELEAGLPITKADGDELIKQMTRLADLLINGYSSTTTTVTEPYYRLNKRSEGGAWEDWTHDVTKSDLDTKELWSIGKKIKKNRRVYNRYDGPSPAKDFTGWAEATKAAIGPFKEALNNPDGINNRDPAIQAFKLLASKMSNCLRRGDCVDKFVDHTMEVYKK